MSLPRIFVQIASYRDPECQRTVKDLFEKAEHPERIFVGICWQCDPEEDKDCFEIPYPYPDQVRTKQVHWKETGGVCWARNETQKLWRGEEYTFQIDAHMLFPKNWDTMIIEEHKSCGNEKAILTCYTAPYQLPDIMKLDAGASVLLAKPFDDKGTLRFKGAYLANQPEKPLPGAFISCHMFFARGNVFEEVPPDPLMYFNQEEISLSLRLFTHGWHIYHPSKVLCYHLYFRNLTTKRYNSPWTDSNKWNDMEILGRKRFDHLTKYKISDDPAVIKDLDKYGLGKVRSLEEYQTYSGVDFRNRTLAEQAERWKGFAELE